MKNVWVLCVITLAACSGSEPTASPGGTASVESGRWHIAELDGQPLDDGAWLAIDLQGRTIQASVGCNELRASFTGTAEALTVGPVAATKKGCPDPLMARERRLTELLSAAREMALLDDGLLRVSGERGVLLARPADP